MSVVSTEVLDRTCASVIFKGARGGMNEIVVHLNRRGTVEYGFGEKGALSGWLKPASVPAHVQQAALEALKHAD